MTAERFGQLIRDPERVLGVHATELEELIARFPWCGVLRRLRLRRAEADGNEADAELWRSRAAPYLVRGRQVLLLPFAACTAAPPVKERVQLAADADALARMLQREFSQPARRSHVQVSKEDEAAELVSDLAQATEALDDYLYRHQFIMPYQRPDPTPKESLESYKRYKGKLPVQSLEELLSLADKGSAKQGGRNRKSAAKRAGRRPSPGVASLTLANLLAAQGRTEEARAMYEELALRYPDRRAIFADRIQRLASPSKE